MGGRDLRTSAAAPLLLAALAWPRLGLAQTPAPPTAPNVTPDVPRVLVHVEGAPDAVVQQDAKGDGQWTTVCTGSCDALVPLGPATRIDGDGLRTSSTFHLDAPAGGRVTLNVAPGSSGRFATGLFLVPIGVLAILGGSYLTLAALASGGGSEAIQPPPPSPVPGEIVIGLGAAVVIGGVVLLVHDATTSVRQASAAPAAPPPAASGPPAPAWRERTPEERALPVAAVAPLWVGRF